MLQYGSEEVEDELPPQSGKLSDDNLGELRSSLRDQLQKSGMTNLIQEMVREICASQQDVSSLNPDEIVQEVYRKGLMSDFLKKVKEGSADRITETRQSANENKISNRKKLIKTKTIIVRDGDRRCRSGSRSSQQHSNEEIRHKFSHNLDSSLCEYSTDAENPDYFAGTDGPMNGKYFLKIEIDGGKGFLEDLYNEETDKLEHQKSKFVLHVFYKSQRFRGEPCRCRSEPSFNDTFMVELGGFENGSIFQLLAMEEPLRIILVRDHDGITTLVSHCVHDWRPILMSERSSQRYPLEFMGIGPEHRVPIGVLNICISILPTLEEQLSESTYMDLLGMEKTKQDEKYRLYLMHAKHWWKEFLEIRPAHKTRLVKLFSYDENTFSRPATSFVRSIAADRVLQTPYQALRFVSLLSICSANEIENMQWQGANLESTTVVLSSHWQTLESTLATRAGNIEDHAILLCSLLLGFGFDAYVAIGTKLGDVAWVWVITFDNDFCPTFWDPVKGENYEHLLTIKGKGEAPLADEKDARLEEKRCHKFKTVSCIFNERCFLANIQPSELIEHTDWHLTNPSRWKKLQEAPHPSKKTGSACIPCSPALFSPRANPTIMALELESNLRAALFAARKNHSLQTKWDDEISKLIGQEHARCELAFSSGLSVKSFPNNLSTLILRRIKTGYEYKGFPVVFTTRDSSKIFFECMRKPECEKIILCRGVEVNHALRVDIFLYPEDVTLVRVTVACKYISAE